MIRTLYIIIISYFLIGGIAFYFISKKKTKEEAHQNRIKYIVYFIIINALFLSIVFLPLVFRVLGWIIIVTGFYELVNLFVRSGYLKKRFFLVSIFIYALFATGFLLFTAMDKEKILFTFVILSVFDSFSQITGQLLGKHKIAPSTSPRKTWEGAAGGLIVSLITAVLIKELIGMGAGSAILLAAGIVLWALLGDLTASFYKRHYNVKDYSRLIPGHGGVLDRFDSLIAGGAWTALMGYLINL
ncbi:MAG TPA: phosphatidate cytidylyltransferase [Bacteroidales bacterium]|nr:phosphatidate cytidylyltransferase [Bacteroidales bacterium]